MQIDELIKTIVYILAGFGVVIDLTPSIKINPVKCFLSYFGNAINGDIKKELKDLKSDVKNLKQAIDKHEVDDIRFKIINFSNECRNGVLHTKDAFVNIIQLQDKYHRILEENDMTNGQIDIEYAYICDTYRKCLELNKFM